MAGRLCLAQYRKQSLDNSIKIDTDLLDQVDASDKALIRQQAGVAYVDENASSDEKKR